MVLIVIIQQFFKKILRNGLPVLAIAMVVLILAGTVGSFLAEHSVNTGFPNLWDSFWWTIVTISTVGYGDRWPLTVAGRIIGMVLMVGGPVIMASALGSIGVNWYNRWMKGVRGMAQVKAKEHLILCGWNEKAKNILGEIRAAAALEKLHVTIIDEHCETKPVDDSNVTFVRGNAADAAVLKLANVDEAKYAIVLADDGSSSADQKTVLTVLTIEKSNAEIISSAELRDSSYAEHLKDAGCDIIINSSDITGKLLAMSLQNTSVSRVITDLVSGEGDELYRVKVPVKYIGRDFITLLKELKTVYNIVIIGIERGEESTLNPPSEFTVKEGDYLLVVAPEYPQLDAKL